MSHADPLTYPEYVTSVLVALDRAREEAIPREAAYLDRVVGLARTSVGTIGHKASVDRDTTPSRLPLALRRARRLIAGAAGAVRRMHSMFRQLRLLRRASRSKAPNALAVAIASNRLPFSDGFASPRANLAWLGRCLGDSTEQPIAAAIADAEYVLVFDPLPLSGYWARYRSCHDEQILIVDGAFLLLQMLIDTVSRWRVFAAACRGCAEYYRATETTHGTWNRIKRSLGCFVAARGYDAVLGRFTDVNGVFFTCNSVLTELLRADLIARDACGRIDEIMHGVGERSGERFFAWALREGEHFGALRKHWFIPQIPTLPLVGVHGTQAGYDGKLAVNAYLNRYFADQLVDGRDVDSLLAAECRRINRTAASDPYVVTMFGNFSSWDDIEASAFAAERLLIQRVRAFLQRLDAPSVFVYVPHPLQPTSLLTPELLGGDDIVVYPKSIVCWLISDASLSLVSSAMWEAAYFGARAFTPLIESDGLFTDEYLELLTRPAGPSLDEFDRALDGFLASTAACPREALLTRASRRIRLMLGANVQTVPA